MARANGKFASTAGETPRLAQASPAVDAATHAIVAAEVSPETVGDNEVLPTLLNPLRRKIEQVSADGAYDTKACYALLQKKGAKATIPPRKMRHSGRQAIHATRRLPRSRQESWSNGKGLWLSSALDS